MKILPYAKTKATREAWLTRAIPTMCEWLRAAGASKFPAPLVSMGLPSKGALALGKRRIGECWTEKASGSGKRCQIFVSPVLDNAYDVLEVFIHELVHAAVGVKHGHDATFKALALGVGLTGPMRATVAGPALRLRLERLARQLGAFPHDALKHFRSPIKKQVTRQRLYECDACNQKIRAAHDSLVMRHYCDATLDGKQGLFILKDSPNLTIVRGAALVR